MKSILSSALAAFAVLAGASTGGLPPRSFIKSPVTTTQGLVVQLNDAQVRSAYERHYGTNRKVLEKFFKSLRISRVTKAMKVLAYHVDPKTGQLGSRIVTLHAGEILFVSQSGTPMLIGKCGNPLGKKIWLPAEPAAARTKAGGQEAAVADAAAKRDLTNDHGGMANLPESIIQAEQSEVPSSVAGPESTEVSLPDPAPELTPSMPTQPTPATPESTIAPAKPSAGGWAIPLVLGGGGLLWALGGHGGGGTVAGSGGLDPNNPTGGGTGGAGGGSTGGSGNTGGGSTGGSNTGGGTGGGGDQPVPEPATLLAMGLGIGVFARRRLR